MWRTAGDTVTTGVVPAYETDAAFVLWMDTPVVFSRGTSVWLCGDIFYFIKTPTHFRSRQDEICHSSTVAERSVKGRKDELWCSGGLFIRRLSQANLAI